MCVVVYAGDSRSMTIEHINDIYNLVKRVDKNIWLHVDACNGFCLCFDSELKKKLYGIEKCDSISMDPHKMLMMPYTASILLVKDTSKMASIRTKSDLIMNDGLSLGQITPFLGSKSWMSLKIWCVMEHYGISELAKIMRTRYELARYLNDKLEKHVCFRVLNEVDAFSVMFVYYPHKKIVSTEILNKINIKIYEDMKKDRKYYLHQFPIIDQRSIVSFKETVFPLRYFSGNERMTRKHIDEMLEYICEKGDYIYENSLY